MIQETREDHQGEEGKTDHHQVQIVVAEVVVIAGMLKAYR